jgi:hypothetical protein
MNSTLKNNIAFLPVGYHSTLCFLLSLIFIVIPFLLMAQVPEVPSNNTEQQLEAITETSDDNETEDDSFLQQLQQFLKNPVNLNTADAALLKELVILSPLQIQNFILYRNLLGDFISIYELQAVPGWDVRTIQRLKPYVSINNSEAFITSFGQRLTGGTNSFLIRASQALEKSRGYKPPAGTAANFYPGSPQKLFVRYKYQYKNLLQFGVSGEKDAGEEFFKGSQKQGFDFYSAHFFVRNIGVIKSLALGDFTVNMGQGLTQWQNLAFKKGPDVINIKRQLAVLRPYNSAGEINFHRGAGITLLKNNWEATFFASYKKTDANFVADTLNSEDYISSLQTSGLHRTKSELEDKHVQQQLAAGGNISYTGNNLHIGINAIQYHFKLPLNKSADPYNLYSLSGKNFGNYSIDYSYTFKNMHFFGEAATTGNFSKAFINGMIVSVDAKVDMSLLYRNISPQYQSLYTNAFTENTFPTNEKGMYAGISIRPNDFWRIDAYADFYKFPWLKYLVDAPSVGADYLLQATYRPDKQLEMYMRYRSETKSKNYNPAFLPLPPVVNKPKKNLRMQVNYKINQVITFRNRADIIWFDKKGQGTQNGFLSYADIIYKPLLKKYSGNLRLQYFETDGYDSRLYAYENDVLYSYSIPVFYDKGFRYYFNFNYDLNRKTTVWLRWAQTIYKDKNVIGSGPDEIKGNKKSEIKIQVRYLF